MSVIQHADVSRYTYRVTWSAEDGEFVATCAEFPSLSWLAESQAASLLGLVDLVADTVADLEADGESVPEPLSERDYSGKFNLRVGKTLHRRAPQPQPIRGKTALRKFLSNIRSCRQAGDGHSPLPQPTRQGGEPQVGDVLEWRA